MHSLKKTQKLNPPVSLPDPVGCIVVACAYMCSHSQFLMYDGGRVYCDAVPYIIIYMFNNLVKCVIHSPPAYTSRYYNNFMTCNCV